MQHIKKLFTFTALTCFFAAHGSNLKSTSFTEVNELEYDQLMDLPLLELMNKTIEQHKEGISVSVLDKIIQAIRDRKDFYQDLALANQSYNEDEDKFNEYFRLLKRSSEEEASPSCQLHNAIVKELFHHPSLSKANNKIRSAISSLHNHMLLSEERQKAVQLQLSLNRWKYGSIALGTLVAFTAYFFPSEFAVLSKPSILLPLAIGSLAAITATVGRDYHLGKNPTQKPKEN